MESDVYTGEMGSIWAGIMINVGGQ